MGRREIRRRSSLKSLNQRRVPSSSPPWQRMPVSDSILSLLTHPDKPLPTSLGHTLQSWIPSPPGPHVSRQPLCPSTHLLSSAPTCGRVPMLLQLESQFAMQCRGVHGVTLACFIPPDRKFENVYIGWGLRYSSAPFNPALPPPVQEEFPTG